MNPQLEQGSPHYSTITLEIVSDNSHDSDPALVDAVGRDAIDALSRDGFTIKPVYTGERGGFIVDVLIPLLTTTWTNKDIILGDGSALVTLITPIFTLIQHLRAAYEKRIGKDAFQQTPIKISVEISGVPISIEAPDLETAEGAMMLARRFQTHHPTVASRVTLQSSIKVKGTVPKRPSRRRR